MEGKQTTMKSYVLVYGIASVFQPFEGIAEKGGDGKKESSLADLKWTEVSIESADPHRGKGCSAHPMLTITTDLS